MDQKKKKGFLDLKGQMYLGTEKRERHCERGNGISKSTEERN